MEFKNMNFFPPDPDVIKYKPGINEIKLYEASKYKNFELVKELIHVSRILMKSGVNPFNSTDNKIKIFLTKVLIRRSRKHLLRKLKIYEKLEKYIIKDIIDFVILKFL